MWGWRVVGGATLLGLASLCPLTSHHCRPICGHEGRHSFIVSWPRCDFSVIPSSLDIGDVAFLSTASSNGHWGQQGPKITGSLRNGAQNRDNVMRETGARSGTVLVLTWPLCRAAVGNSEQEGPASRDGNITPRERVSSGEGGGASSSGC